MNYNKAFVALFTYLILLFAYIFTRGFYSFEGAVFVLLALILLLGQLLNYKFRLINNFDKNNFVFLVKIVVFFSICLSLILYGGLYQQIKVLVTASKIILALAVIISTLLFIKEPTNKFLGYLFQKKYLLLLIFAFLLRLLMIISSPTPRIDVWDKLMIASKGILEGKSPYLLEFTEIYPGMKTTGFGRLPGLFVFFAPIYLLFKEVRYVYLLGDLVFIYLVLKILKRYQKPILKDFSLIYLYNPVSLFVFEQSWEEPFMLVLLFAFFTLTVLGRRRLTIFSLAIFLSTKRFNCLILPLLAKFRRINKKDILLSLLVVFFIILPFFMLDPREFLNDMLLTHFKEGYNTAPVHIALTFRNMLKEIFNVYYGTVPALIISTIFALVTYLFIKVDNFFKFFLTTAFLYLGFVFFSTQAFCNYFFFVSGLIIFSLIAFFLAPEKKDNLLKI